MNSPAHHHHQDPVIVVGSGLAGMLAAHHLARSGPVILVTKGVIDAGSSQHAQGGLAAAVGIGDTPAWHIADTLAAGAGLCDPSAVAVICEDGPARVQELIDLGVAFDRDPDGTLALAMEGAHDRPRVVHAGGDATGAHIVAALVAVVRADPRIDIRERTVALEVVVEAGEARGLWVREPSGERRRLDGRATVLATGGMGHLFSRTTNPSVATADGAALAHRAGALLADLELVQFHPTALALGHSPLALVSEAVRGAGAYLRDARGNRFMLALHPMAELGPRDVVARAIAAQAAADDRDVTLDLRHLKPAGVYNHFPTVAAACREHGLDLARDTIPVTPATHYAMGGALTDTWGRTTVPRLWAIGECACTGAHGANRLASNSLLEAATMAVRCAGAVDMAEWSNADPAPTRAPRPVEANWRATLQGEIWEHAGVVRDATGLTAAAAILGHAPSGDDHETGNLRDVAELMVAAALIRQESRGGHFRTDFPDQDPRWLVRIAWRAGEPIDVPLNQGPRARKEAA